MAPPLKAIDPKTPRWEPAADSSTIVVPGLDTTASVNDQIEQIEQLITIKLQNVDANFSKIQQIMANRILPAVKRYAVGTEPVREAAKFWTTFFEQAAQIRVPTYEEYNEDNETQTEQESDSQAVPEQSQAEHISQDASVAEASQSFQPDQTSSEVSFMPGHAAVMSTPATTRHQSQQSTYLVTDEPTQSWSASLESPLIRLDRELQSLTRDDEVSVASSSVLQHESQYDTSQDVTERQMQLPTFDPPSQRNISLALNDKGKRKETTDSLRHNVLRRGIDTSSNPMRNPSLVSPLKVKGKTPILKSMNPYLSPGIKPSEWKGVVDLKDPTVATPKGKTPRGKTRFAAPASTKRSTTPGPDPDLDLDDDLDATLGMSPPVMMAFAQLPKPATAKLGRTPRKEAAERIMKNILDVEKRLGAPSGSHPSSKYGGPIFSKPGGAGTTESSLTSAPTPPSLSRYNRNAYPPASEISNSLADASLESMMRRVGLNVTGFDYRSGKAVKEDLSSISSSIPSVPSGNAYARPSLNQGAYSSASTAAQEQEPIRTMPSPPPPMFDMRRLVDDELVDPNANDDSSDSLDYDDQDASEAFLVAQQGMQYDDDNSFSSGGSSDMDDEGGVHPFVHGISVEDDGDAFDDEDSYDDPHYNGESTEEETLFGVPPAQRLAREAAQAQNRMSEANLRMLGQELLEDTIGIGAQVARAGGTEETPTPWPR